MSNQSVSAIITRRKFLQVSTGLGISLLGYGSLIEPEWVSVTHRTIPISAAMLSQPLRILHISDLHHSNIVKLSYLRTTLMTAIQLKPDIVCITGDFITHRILDAEGYRQIFCEAFETLPVYACLGNHDGGKWAKSRNGYPDTTAIAELLSGTPVTLLQNESYKLTINGQKLDIVGLGDWWAGNMDTRFLAENHTEVNMLRIILSHNPDTKKFLQQYTWQLLLSGHTHGGQICFPVIGPPFAPVVDTRFIEGLHRWNNRWLHITRGIGNVRGIRLNCRPEVSLLTLHPTST
jgi:hypothetical protein